MVGLKNGHICKNLTQNGDPQRSSWGVQKKKKKKKKKSNTKTRAENMLISEIQTKADLQLLQKVDRTLLKQQI